MNEHRDHKAARSASVKQHVRWDEPINMPHENKFCFTL